MKVKKYGAIAAIFCFTVCLAGKVQADDSLLQELKRMIEAQQAQIDKQAEEIKALKDQLAEFQKAVGADTEEIAVKAIKDEIKDQKVDKLVSSKDPNVDVVLYGQINRGFLWADNGDASKYYFVDNDNSSSRLGVSVKADASGLTFGGKTEFELESNSSNKVNQLEQDSNLDIKIRHVDAWVSGNFGKFSLGRGDTASNGTSEVDLSGTSVVTYSGIADMAGGQLWYEGDTGTLTDLTVSNVFDQMDGLSLADRIRYDTPSLAGFTLSGSAVEDEAFDLALRYSRKFSGVRLGAAAAWANPGNKNDFNNQYNGSISLLHDSGLNATFALGTQDYEETERNDPTFWYAKLGYKADIFSYGSSAFSIDYTDHKDVNQNGDKAKSFSLAYVQNLIDWGTELYLAYRLHQLDRDEATYDDINAVLGGARIKF